MDRTPRNGCGDVTTPAGAEMAGIRRLRWLAGERPRLSRHHEEQDGHRVARESNDESTLSSRDLVQFVAALIGLGAPLFAREAQAPGIGAASRRRELAGAVPVCIGEEPYAAEASAHRAAQSSEAAEGHDCPGVWLGELLIGTDVLVVRRLYVRADPVTPPLPAFNRAIAEAMGAWEFEPLTIESKASGCLTATFRIAR